VLLKRFSSRIGQHRSEGSDDHGQSLHEADLQRGRVDANDPDVRRFAPPRRSTPLTWRRVGRSIFVLWGGSVGTEAIHAAKPVARGARPFWRGDQRHHLHRRAAITSTRIAPRTPEAQRAPRRILLADTVVTTLAFIESLGFARTGWAVNPESRTRRWSSSRSNTAWPRLVGGQALPHRLKRPANWPIRPRLPLRHEEVKEAFLPRPSLGDVGAIRACRKLRRLRVAPTLYRASVGGPRHSHRPDRGSRWPAPSTSPSGRSARPEHGRAAPPSGEAAGLDIRAKGATVVAPRRAHRSAIVTCCRYRWHGPLRRGQRPITTASARPPGHLPAG